MKLRGARDGHDPRFAGEEPGQRDLTRRRSPGRGDLPHPVDKREVVLEGFGTEARDAGAQVVVLVNRGRGADRAGEEAFAQRTVRDEADAEFAAGVEDAFLRAPPPERVLALNRGDGLNGVGPPDG